MILDINYLACIAESTNKQFPDDQKIDMAYIILQNKRNFTPGLIDWDKTQTKLAATAQSNN